MNETTPITEQGLTESEIDEVISRALLVPAFRAAGTIGSLQDKQLGNLLLPLTKLLGKQQVRVRKNDTAYAVDTLFAQAQTLDALFHCLTQKALNSDNLPLMQTLMSMALKAQNQSRASLVSLSGILNPQQFAYVKQANINQALQVNHGVAATTPELPQDLGINEAMNFCPKNIVPENELLGVPK